MTLELNGVEVDQRPAPVFERSTMSDGRPRLVLEVPDGQADLLKSLSGLLAEPLYVLYVLHTPRGEGEPGRYASPDLTHDEVDHLLLRYQRLFADDGRHDVWVHSDTDGRTLIWDRHNRLFAEGVPVDEIAEALMARGFTEGRLPASGPHIHHYRPENDADAASLLAELDWRRTPLRPVDEQ